MMDKLLEISTTPPDGALAVVTQGKDGPHVVNTWNSYVIITDGGNLLIPAGRMQKTEVNVTRDNRVKLTVCNREVQGKSYKGTGVLVEGTAEFKQVGPEFEAVKGKFPWARAALAITVLAIEQTL